MNIDYKKLYEEHRLIIDVVLIIALMAIVYIPV